MGMAIERVPTRTVARRWGCTGTGNTGVAKRRETLPPPQGWDVAIYETYDHDHEWAPLLDY